MTVTHKTRLTILTLALHALVTIWVFGATHLPSFDSSASVVTHSTWQTALLRWDVFHFLHIAQNHYEFEHEFAFFPGITCTIREVGSRLSSVFGFSGHVDGAAMLLGGYVVTIVAGVGSVRTLYELTLEHFGSPSMALLVSILSLLSSSPATLRLAPYAEPFFTLFSYRGMLACARGRYLSAALSFTLAASFRANGVLLSGFIIWGMLVQPSLLKFASRTERPSLGLGQITSAVIFSSFPVLAFAFEQWAGYFAFCTTLDARPWCNNRLPLIYFFVQSEYWNNGLFNYWTIQQLPNILLAAPILALLYSCAIRDVQRALELSLLAPPRTTHAEVPASFSILPHAIHAFLVASMLLFGAHTQIALRLAASMPYTYWSAASLFIDTPVLIASSDGHPKSRAPTKEEGTLGRYWVGWSVLWGAISLTTWATFLPPA